VIHQKFPFERRDAIVQNPAMAARDIDRTEANPPDGDTLRGFLFALSAYLMWGFLPFYMKAVAHISSLEIVAHRVLWSVPIAGAILWWLGRTADIPRALVSPRTLAMGAVTAALISVNWLIYVWAIAVDRALETALGYYINPLISVCLGAVFLRERLTRAQQAAVGLAVIAVAILTWESGGLPWVSLALAISWGLYALAKKTLPIGPAQGFFLEVVLLAPIAIGYVVFIEATGRGSFSFAGNGDAWWLFAAGPVTAIPLIVYATGAKLLRLSTIGIMQYIAPTMIFVIAVFIFREPFSGTRAVAFVLIWAALVVYSASMFAGQSKAA
jgi:chloramphenicol-sensitive protein RarD